MGSAVVQVIGFPWLMRVMALLNLCYCPVLCFLKTLETNTPSETQVTGVQREGLPQKIVIMSVNPLSPFSLLRCLPSALSSPIFVVIKISYIVCHMYQ